MIPVACAPIALDRIDYDRDKGLVNYSTDKFGILEIDVLDFIARLAVQVPNPYERLLVYYGLYSNASAIRKQIPVEEDDMKIPFSYTLYVILSLLWRTNLSQAEWHYLRESHSEA